MADQGTAARLDAGARTNWAGSHTYRAARLHRPATLDELRRIVAGARRLRVLGSGHSFTDIADSEEQLSLAGLPPELAVDRLEGTVSFNPAMTYGELARLLNEHRLALANLASLPHISVAGAVATATHGSGDANGSRATSVAGLELVTSEGDLVELRRGDPDFEGAVVSLGALGAVTRITLDVLPAFEIRQRAFHDIAWDDLLSNFDAIMASGYSVSVFSRWGPSVEQVWVKSRGVDPADDPPAGLTGARLPDADCHPILGLDATNATAQLGVPGPWALRLPHFRLGFVPSSGQELQSEFMVARRDAVAAIRAVRKLSEMLAPLTLVSELRTVAADALWMSPMYGRDTLAIHFTWVPSPDEVSRALAPLEAALAPFAARPHWGKVFLARAKAIAPLYKRSGEFAKLVARLDARGAFTNAWLRERVLGS